MPEELFSVDRVAELLELHPKTIRRFIREGRLNAVKVGGQWRILNKELSRFMGDGDGVQNSLQPLEPILEYQKELKLKVTVSAVVDVAVADRTEADRLSTLILASMNSRGASSGSARCEYLYQEKKGQARFVFWGKPSFVSVMLEMIAAVSKEDQDEC